MSRVLITGIAGFLGSHLCDYLLRMTDWEIIGLTRLSHSGNLNRLAQMPAWPQEGHRVRLVHHDLRSPISSQLAKQIGQVDVILHLGASTHVDRSISDPLSFVMDNLVGTCNLLDYARSLEGLYRFVYFSTDEVMGPSDGRYFHEWDRHKAANPYAATKSGAEQLCWSFQNTYKLPIFVARGMNLLGPFQHIEKFLPSTINKIRLGEEVLIHADPSCTIPGARSYIHVRNVAAALVFLLDKAEIGEAYHVIGEEEINNLDFAERISRQLGMSLRFKMIDFHSSRPGHDILYRLDGGRMARMGWKIPLSFDDSLRETVKWYIEHPEWL